MTQNTRLKKFGTVALGAVCVFFAVKLIAELAGSPMEAVRGQETGAGGSSPAAGAAKRPGQKSRAGVDPGQAMQGLQDYVSRPLPENPRDPFDFGTTPPPKGAGRIGAPGVAGAQGGPAAPAPPPPPQVPFHALGYSVRAGIGGEAYLADADQVYIVHLGEVVLNQYKIVSLTPSTVEVRNAASGETVQLPIPQVQ